jgi:arylsulfatase A-like enzyme
MDADPKWNANYPRMPLQIDSMESLRKWVDGYDVGIKFLDDHLGQIFQQLRELGVWDETAIILTADHGENLGELNIWGDHQTADEITCRLPLIVRWPGITDGGAVDEALHYQFDWAATMLQLLGGQVPSNWDGRSFAQYFVAQASSGREHLILSQGAWAVQRAVRFDNYLCMFTWHAGFKQLGAVMLFDVAADPHEEHDLAMERPDLVREAQARLTQWEYEQIARADGNVDPLRTVLLEGGPFHCRRELPAYLARLRETGRGHHAQFLAALHPKDCS